MTTDQADTAPLPIRTRAFATLLKATTKEMTPETMPAARARRADQLRSRLGRIVFGDDHSESTVTEGFVELDGFTSRLRIHAPAKVTRPLPIVVNYHGGGWCQGSPEQSRWIAGQVAVGVGAVVVSPTYRLAPEHPYPAGPDDAWALLEWIADHGSELGGDPERLAVMGDSAGGGLAAVTALKSREAGIPLRGQVLIYPGVEMYDRFPSEDEQAEAPVLTSKGMRAYTHMYLGDNHGVLDWQASPIRGASHADLPPALILTAGHDPLRDNGRLYAGRLREAGSEVELINHPDTIHGFVSLPGVCPAAAPARDQIVDFLRRVL